MYALSCSEVCGREPEFFSLIHALKSSLYFSFDTCFEEFTGPPLNNFVAGEREEMLLMPHQNDQEILVEDGTALF